MDLEPFAAAHQVETVADSQPLDVVIPEQPVGEDVQPENVSELPDCATTVTPNVSDVKTGDQDTENHSHIRPSLRMKRYLEEVGNIKSKSF